MLLSSLLITVLAIYYVGGVLYIKFVSRRYHQTVGILNIDAIAVHTYKPAGDRLPNRGRLVVKKTHELAMIYNCPIVLGVGNTVSDSLSESEIYRNYLKMNLSHRGQIYTGTNPLVRDTVTEAKEIYKICQQKNFQNILIIGLAPHLVTRIVKYWNQINRPYSFNVYFLAVPSPLRYYFWELTMLIAEIILPPHSRRRQLLFRFLRNA